MPSVKPGFVIGGGPSLKGFDFERLRNRRCLAVNMAFKDVFGAWGAYIGDARLINKLSLDPYWPRFQGKRFTRRDHWYKSKADPGTLLGRFRYRLLDSMTVWSSYPGSVVHLGNGGLAAMNVAELHGWDPIFLLGFDCSGDRGDGRMANYHDRYPRGWAKPAAYLEKKFVNSFEAVKKGIRSKVYNCNPDSALDVFEKITFERALEICDSKSELTARPT